MDNPFASKPEPKKSHAGLSMTREQREMFDRLKAYYRLESDSAVLKMGLKLLVDQMALGPYGEPK